MPCEQKLEVPCPHPAIANCSNCRIELCVDHVFECEKCEQFFCADCLPEHERGHGRVAA